MKKILKYAGIGLAGVIVLLIAGITEMYFSADMKQPVIQEGEYLVYTLEEEENLRIYGPNSLQLNKNGLWELNLTGDAFERGVAFGELSKDLLYYQEKVFVDQIREIIPSDSYLKFLRFFLILFNRNLGKYVPEEFRKEIYGISLSCTDEYNMIGTPYERQLNYHAAHDIGHAMQDYMLVGCSSFGVWGDESADSTLLIGRNFDFYMGDDFARHKLVSFYHPAEGYRFASVGWPGMTGVLSGMNETGLTVTINAAKSTVPVSAAMPISLLAREILQYASTIDEAYAIASRRKTFVAESLLIGSARDGKAAIIEKAPDKIALFMPEGNRIICTNHYQSEVFESDKRNQENIATSDSPYRYARLEELLDQSVPLVPDAAATILRDRFGWDGKDIGLANEKAINQFIAHHSVVFQPEKRMMWVSTGPWQSGDYVAYDLEKIFAAVPGTSIESVDSLMIPADEFVGSPQFENLLSYRSFVKKVRQSMREGKALDDEENSIKAFVMTNPEMYYTWQLAGDYYYSFGEKEKAIPYWETALEKEIPRLQERESIEKRIQKSKP